jgi:hypothetical protein
MAEQAGMGLPAAVADGVDGRVAAGGEEHPENGAAAGAAGGGPHVAAGERPAAGDGIDAPGGRLASQGRRRASGVVHGSHSIGARIAACERELAALRQREALARTVAAVIGEGIAFSARELFDLCELVPELAAAFEASGVRDARTLGIRLAQLRDCGLRRVGVDERGAIWVVD